MLTMTKCLYPAFADDLDPADMPEAFLFMTDNELPPELPPDDAPPQVFNIDDEDHNFGQEFMPVEEPEIEVPEDEAAPLTEEEVERQADEADDQAFINSNDFDDDFNEDFEEELDDEYDLNKIEADGAEAEAGDEPVETEAPDDDTEEKIPDADFEE